MAGNAVEKTFKINDQMTATIKKIVKEQEDLVKTFNAGDMAIEDFDREMAELDRHLATAKSAMDRMNRSTGEGISLFDRFSSFATKINMIGGAFQQVAGAVGSILRPLEEGWEMLADYEAGLGQVATLLDESQEAEFLPQFEEQMKDISKASGATLDVLNDGLYNLISAGVDAADSMETLEIATKAAIAGATDTGVAVDGLTTAMNSMGITSQEAADIMFTTVRLGKTTFEELSASMGQVLPMANAIGVSFEEVGAALAQMTAAGINTAQASTALNALLTEFSTEAAIEKFQDLGIDLVDATTGEMKDLGEIMTQTIQLGFNPNELANMISSAEARRAFLTLVDGAENASGEMVSAMEAGLEAFSPDNLVGALEDAYSDMEDLTVNEQARIARSWEQVMMDLGEAFKPLQDAFMAIQTNIIGRISDFLSSEFGGGIDLDLSWIDGVIERIADFMASAWEFGKGIYDAISGLFSALDDVGIVDIFDSLWDVAGNLLEDIGKIATNIGEWLGSLEESEGLTRAIYEGMKLIADIASEVVSSFDRSNSTMAKMLEMEQLEERYMERMTGMQGTLLEMQEERRAEIAAEVEQIQTALGLSEEQVLALGQQKNAYELINTIAHNTSLQEKERLEALLGHLRGMQRELELERAYFEENAYEISSALANINALPSGMTRTQWIINMREDFAAAATEIQAGITAVDTALDNLSVPAAVSNVLTGGGGGGDDGISDTMRRQMAFIQELYQINQQNISDLRQEELNAIDDVYERRRQQEADSYQAQRETLETLRDYYGGAQGTVQDVIDKIGETNEQLEDALNAFVLSTGVDLTAPARDFDQLIEHVLGNEEEIYNIRIAAIDQEEQLAVQAQDLAKTLALQENYQNRITEEKERQLEIDQSYTETIEDLTRQYDRMIELENAENDTIRGQLETWYAIEDLMREQGYSLEQATEIMRIRNLLAVDEEEIEEEINKQLAIKIRNAEEELAYRELIAEKEAYAMEVRMAALEEEKRLQQELLRIIKEKEELERQRQSELQDYDAELKYQLGLSELQAQIAAAQNQEERDGLQTLQERIELNHEIAVMREQETAKLQDLGLEEEEINNRLDRQERILRNNASLMNEFEDATEDADDAAENLNRTFIDIGRQVRQTAFQWEDFIETNFDKADLIWQGWKNIFPQLTKDFGEALTASVGESFAGMMRGEDFDFYDMGTTIGQSIGDGLQIALDAYLPGFGGMIGNLARPVIEEGFGQLFDLFTPGEGESYTERLRRELKEIEEIHQSMNQLMQAYNELISDADERWGGINHTTERLTEQQLDAAIKQAIGFLNISSDITEVFERSLELLESGTEAQKRIAQNFINYYHEYQKYVDLNASAVKILLDELAVRLAIEQSELAGLPIDSDAYIAQKAVVEGLQNQYDATKLIYDTKAAEQQAELERMERIEESLHNQADEQNNINDLWYRINKNADEYLQKTIDALDNMEYGPAWLSQMLANYEDMNTAIDDMIAGIGESEEEQERVLDVIGRTETALQGQIDAYEDSVSGAAHAIGFFTGQTEEEIQTAIDAMLAQDQTYLNMLAQMTGLEDYRLETEGLITDEIKAQNDALGTQDEYLKRLIREGQAYIKTGDTALLSQNKQQIVTQLSNLGLDTEYINRLPVMASGGLTSGTVIAGESGVEAIFNPDSTRILSSVFGSQLPAMAQNPAVAMQALAGNTSNSTIISFGNIVINATTNNPAELASSFADNVVSALRSKNILVNSL